MNLSLNNTRELLDETRTAALLSNYVPENITHIKLSNNSFGLNSSSILCQFLAKTTKLKSLDLSDIIAGRETEVGLSVLQNISTVLASSTPQLTEIDFSYNALGSRGVTALHQMFNTLSSLEKIVFNDVGLSASSCIELGNYLLPSAATLKCLHFSENAAGGEGAIHIAPAIAACSHLEDFSWRAMRCDHEGGHAILQALVASGTTALKRLDLSDNSFQSLSYSNSEQLLRKLLSRNRDLEYLNLSDINLGDVGIKAVLEVLGGNTTATTAVTTAVHVTSATTTTTTTTPTPSTTYTRLKEIDLSFNKLTTMNHALKHFPDVATNCPVLEEFGFEENHVGDSGCEYFGHGLRLSNSLMSLNLKRCGIRDTGALQISNEFGRSDCLRYSKMLENSAGNKCFLDLNGNFLSAPTIALIHKTCGNACESFSDNEENGVYDEDDDAYYNEGDEDSGDDDSKGAYSTSMVTHTSFHDEWSCKLTFLCQHYCPQSAGKIPKILNKYHNRQLMIAYLRQKFFVKFRVSNEHIQLCFQDTSAASSSLNSHSNQSSHKNDSSRKTSRTKNDHLGVKKIRRKKVFDTTKTNQWLRHSRRLHRKNRGTRSMHYH